MSSTVTDLNFVVYANEVADAAKAASRVLATTSGELRNRWLILAAQRIRENAKKILDANQRDVHNAPERGLNKAEIDRLTLTPGRLESAAAAIEEIFRLPDPIGEVLEESIRPNGLQVSRVRVPLGVVFFIYESRPNVTVDAAAICVKSGNAVILRGGSEAFESNQAIYAELAAALEELGLPVGSVQLVATTDRSIVGNFLKMDDRINVTIPRGGKSLIERVASANAGDQTLRWHLPRLRRSQRRPRNGQTDCREREMSAPGGV